MDTAHQLFFENHPDPIWIFDPETLCFLDVNQAAIHKLGYSRQEFLAMTIADVRAAEDVPALRKAVAGLGEGVFEGGVWRIYGADGKRLFIDFHWRTIEFHDRKAILAAARDVSRVIELEQEREELLAREEAERHKAQTVADQFQLLFESLPGKFLVLGPENFEIIAASDAYLEATRTRRDDIVGRNLFDVFADDPATPDAEAMRNVRGSLERVKAKRRPDVMAVQCYPIARPADEGGGVEERFWSPLNAPVFAADGSLLYIVHRVEDVTGVVQEGGYKAEENGLDVQGKAVLPELEVLVRSRELKSANVELLEEVTELRNAQRRLGMASFKLELDSGALAVSDNFYNILGVNPGSFEPSAETYSNLVHPADREAMVAHMAAARMGHETHFEVQLRFVRPTDDMVVHVLAVSEVTESSAGRVLHGLLLDITRRVEAEEELGLARQLVDLAGRTARLGGWRVDLTSRQLVWTPETADIHEIPHGTAPTLEEAIDFYVPEHRDRIREVFWRCAEAGQVYDETLQIVTATGRPVWVRAIGEPERDSEGNIIAIQGAFQDVSELVKERDRSEGLSRRLADTLESISDAFFTLDHEWRFTFLNSQAEILLDRRREALLGKVVWDEFPDALNTAFEKEYRRAVDNQETVRFAEYYSPLERWFEVNAYPAPDGLAVYFRDITEERALQAQLRLLETAVSRQSDILLITEAAPIDAPDGPRIVYVNDAFTRRTGYGREEVIGKTPRILQGEKTQKDELVRIRKALEKWQPVRAELINYRKTGEEIWLELDIVPLADEKGWYTHWVSVERDITARKEAEEAVRLNEERFRLVASATNDVIWDWDLTVDRIWWNESMTSQFGYDREALEPGLESWENRIHPKDRARVVESIHAVISGTGSNWVEEYCFLHADGRELIVVDRGFLIRNETGRAVRMVGSMEDVTEQRMLDERLRHSQKLETIGQLTGGVAHDFNNLLTVILGNAEILSDRLSEDESLKSLADMTISAAERGAELTNRLLAFARQQALQPKLVDLNRMLVGIEPLLKRALSEEIEIEIAQGESIPKIEVDPGQLEAALLNLAINARDAMPEGGRLIIETETSRLDESSSSGQLELEPGTYVVLSVSDIGAGMDSETLEHAFEPFYTTKDVGKGSGLGLSMVYGFMKQSGGQARIYSEEGEGTTVRLYFPQAESEQAAPAPEESREGTGSANEHILVVEDNALVREHLVGLLDSLDYRVTDAEDAESALAILKGRSDVDLLFTDVIMPGGMNGSQLAEAAREIYPDLRVLFTSGYTENAIVQNGRLDPGMHLLSKPYRRHELATKLREVLDGSR